MKKTFNNKKKLLLFLILFFSFFLLSTTIAENGETEVVWPNSPTGRAFTHDIPLHELVAYFYEWGIAIGILIVFGILVYAGFQYTISAGSPGKMSEAMDRIKSAGIGLVLLLSSWLILNTINPELVRIQPLDFNISGKLRGFDLTTEEMEDGPSDVLVLYSKKNHRGDPLATILINDRTIDVIQIEIGILEGDLDAGIQSIKTYTAISPEERRLVEEEGTKLEYKTYNIKGELLSGAELETVDDDGERIHASGVKFSKGDHVSENQDGEGLYKEGGGAVVDYYEETVSPWWSWRGSVACGSSISRGMLPTQDISESFFLKEEAACLMIDRKGLGGYLMGSSAGEIEIASVYCATDTSCYLSGDPVDPDDPVPSPDFRILLNQGIGTCDFVCEREDLSCTSVGTDSEATNRLFWTIESIPPPLKCKKSSPDDPIDCGTNIVRPDVNLVCGEDHIPPEWTRCRCE